MDSGVNSRLGSVESFNKNDHGLLIHAKGGHLWIRVCSDSVIQVSLSWTDAFDDFSYAIAADISPVSFSVKEKKDRIILQTASLQLEILKKRVSLIFKNSDGVILNEDEPGLGISWIGEQVTCYKKLQEGERFIGLGEKTGPLDRRGKGYQNWNTDQFAYGSGTDPLYCTTPFYIGLHNKVQYGIFFDNSHKTHFNFGASNNRFSSFSADAGEMNYYFIHGGSVAEIIQNYTWLTGRMPLPPKWSIGYQQCRYSYYPDKEVLSLARTFREKEIPADTIVLDIHYMEDYKIFTWNKKTFSNPKSLLENLRSLGFNVVLMCDPGIKIEKGYRPYDDGTKKDVFVKYPDGKNYSGQVWPGWCYFPDFTKPATRKWWAEKLKSYTDLGVDGFWNDMNEIATWGQMLPDNLEFDMDGHKATARKGRNLYGFQMARSTYEGARKQLKTKRPFNLTRSGYSGVQRYAAVWTGDNVSYDEHMMLGVRLVNSLGLTGVAFAGYDVGGFVGEASPKLFARWITLGAFSPFFRGHTMINSRDSEPWSFGEEVEQVSRNYIRFRYQLLPYLYSLFYESSQTGMPIQRSLAIDHSHDPRVYDSQFQHQYFFGPSILVAPVESDKSLVKVFLPPGKWYSLFDGKKYDGNQEIAVECPVHKLPLFVRGGAILPMQAPVQNTKEKTNELKLHLYKGDAKTGFDFYEDDGSSFEHETGQFALRRMEYSPSGKKLTIGKQQGKFRSQYKSVTLFLHGFGNIISIRIGGKKIKLKKIENSYFLPLEKFDPLGDPDTMGREEVWIGNFLYGPGEIEIGL